MCNTKDACYADSIAESRLLAVFHKTNEYIRNADQKQLTITGAYLGVVAVVLSVLPGGGAAAMLLPRAQALTIYTFLFIAGCCVYLLQAWCRVWKEHYLVTVARIASTWSTPPNLLPYWLREVPAAQPRPLFRLNVDNTLLYFTFGSNTALLGVVCRQLWFAMPPDYRSVAIAVSAMLYIAFVVGTYRLSQNRRDVLRA
jgi:hypothetical protein